MQYEIVKKNGYKGSFEDFEYEYTKDNFNTNTRIHKQFKKEVVKSGAVGILTGDNLDSVEHFQSIGRPDSSGKKGGAWIVSETDQSRLNLHGVDERAAKGIDRMSPSERWEIHYSPDYCKAHADSIVLNSGPSDILGASSASMPGGMSYDLSGRGNSYKEGLMPQEKLDASQVALIKNSRKAGKKVIDLGNGITLRRVN